MKCLKPDGSILADRDARKLFRPVPCSRPYARVVALIVQVLVSRQTAVRLALRRAARIAVAVVFVPTSSSRQSLKAAFNGRSCKRIDRLRQMRLSWGRRGPASGTCLLRSVVSAEVFDRGPRWKHISKLYAARLASSHINTQAVLAARITSARFATFRMHWCSK